jgi:hypothetical protein
LGPRRLKDTDEWAADGSQGKSNAPRTTFGKSQTRKALPGGHHSKKYVANDLSGPPQQREDCPNRTQRVIGPIEDGHSAVSHQIELYGRQLQQGIYGQWSHWAIPPERTLTGSDLVSYDGSPRCRLIAETVRLFLDKVRRPVQPTTPTTEPIPMITMKMPCSTRPHSLTIQCRSHRLACRRSGKRISAANRRSPERPAGDAPFHAQYIF